MTGRTAIITGANSGIGRAAARALAGAGAPRRARRARHGKGEAAAAAIPGEHRGAPRSTWPSLASVRAFADGVGRRRSTC